MIVRRFFPNALNGFPETRVESAATRARTSSFYRGGLTGGLGGGRGPSDGTADETEREKFFRNTKSSLVLVGAAGNRSGKTMTTALPATDGSVSEVNPTYLEDVWRKFHISVAVNTRAGSSMRAFSSAMRAHEQSLRCLQFDFDP